MSNSQITWDDDARSIPNPQFYELMKAVLERGKEFRFQAAGFSMNPFIKDGDMITLMPNSSENTHIGDIVALIHPTNKKLMVHRVVQRKKGLILIKGDRNSLSDGWVIQGDPVGRVTRVERQGHLIKFGLGAERWIIALMSRYQILPLFLRFFGWFIYHFIEKGNP